MWWFIMSTVVLLLLTIASIFLTFYVMIKVSNVNKERMKKTLEQLWQSLSIRLNVPLEAFTHEDLFRVDIPHGEGILEVSYPLSANSKNGVPQTSTTIYKGASVPGWFEFDTARQLNKKVILEPTSSSGGALRCAGVDLSEHIASVFDVWFGDNSEDVHWLSRLKASVRGEQAFFKAEHSLLTPVENMSNKVHAFVMAVECIAEQAPSSEVLALGQLAVHTREPLLFECLTTQMTPDQTSGVRAFMGSSVSTASHETLGIWCAHGFFDIVRDANLKRQDRWDILCHWTKYASLAERSLQDPQSREVVHHLCEGQSLKSLRVSELAATPQVVLPLLMHLFEAHPEEVWQASEKVMGLLNVSEAHVWLQHAQAAAFAITAEHFMRPLRAHDMGASDAQELLEHMRRVASSAPEIMKERVFNTNITRVLPHLSEEAMGGGDRVARPRRYGLHAQRAARAAC